MGKIKKMMLGTALAMCILTGSAGSCYAAVNAASQIAVDVTVSRAYGKFEYGEAGHQIKVTVRYEEVNSEGVTRRGEASDTQFGNVTTAVVSRPNSSGYQYVWAYAVGFVDGVKDAITATVYV